MTERGEGEETRPIPVGDTERQKTVDLLCEAFADDRLPVEEFERRVELAHRAETTDELRTLLSDLPSPQPPARRDDVAPSPPPVARRAGTGAHPTVPADQVAENSVIAGILGGVTRAGMWIPARTNWTVGIMGGFELDFREALFPPGVTEVRVLALMGGGDIVVPPDVRVEVSVTGIMGGFEHHGDAPPTLDPDAPVLRVTGLAVMGGGEISVRYPGETGRDAKRRRKLEKKEQRRIARGG